MLFQKSIRVATKWVKGMFFVENKCSVVTSAKRLIGLTAFQSSYCPLQPYDQSRIESQQADLHQEFATNGLLWTPILSTGCWASDGPSEFWTIPGGGPNSEFAVHSQNETGYVLRTTLYFQSGSCRATNYGSE
jgi:hypothetical protein